MYRFLLTRRWLGLAALMFGLAVVMVGLGNWQLSRYQQKVAINDRIDDAYRAIEIVATATESYRAGQRLPLSGPPATA